MTTRVHGATKIERDVWVVHALIAGRTACGRTPDSFTTLERWVRATEFGHKPEVDTALDTSLENQPHTWCAQCRRGLEPEGGDDG